MDGKLFSFSVEASETGKAEALLELAGATAVSLAGATGSPVLEPDVGATPLWPRVRICAYFPDDTDCEALTRLIERSLTSAETPDTRSIESAEWQRNLHGTFEPLPIGSRLLLVSANGRPPALSGTQMPDGRRIVRLNMGRAFGTGRHPTTRLCLEWLDSEFAPGGTVLDYGSGSGVLAIAALALGAEQVLATDHDPQAVESTRENAMLNGFGERLWTGEPAHLPPAKATLIIANILAGTLIKLEESFAARLEPGSGIVLSGILKAQTDDIEKAYAAHFTRFERRYRDGWALISATRISSEACRSDAGHMTDESRSSESDRIGGSCSSRDARTA
jgi:ribosomal protein L11 methyltransferase